MRIASNLNCRSDVRIKQCEDSKNAIPYGKLLSGT